MRPKSRSPDEVPINAFLRDIASEAVWARYLDEADRERVRVLSDEMAARGCDMEAHIYPASFRLEAGTDDFRRFHEYWAYYRKAEAKIFRAVEMGEFPAGAVG